MKVLIRIFFVVLMLLSSHAEAQDSKPIIHVFGDSHSGEFSKITGCIIHWLGPITMYRVGRDNLAFLNLPSFGVLEKQVVVFVFGEIDVRFHILKQRDLFNRSLDEIIDSLATSYLNTILMNRSLYKNLTCIVYSLTPPTDNYYPEYRYGSLEERIFVTQKLNKKLSKLCKQSHVFFLNVYKDYANEDGSLNIDLSDGTLHIHPDYCWAISQKLNHILTGIKKK